MLDDFKKSTCLIKLAAAAFLVFGCSGNEPIKKEFSDTRVILRVGDKTLTMADLDRKYDGIDFSGPDKEFETKKEYVEQNLQRFLQLRGAIEAGITAEMDSQAQNYYLLRKLYYEDVTSKIEVTERDIRDFFEKYGGEVQFGLIAVRDSVLADSLYGLLENGADFGELAREYTLIEIGKKRGGSFGYVRYGQYDSDLQGRAYDLKEREYTKPFRTLGGWNIMILYDRIKHSEADLDESLKNYEGWTSAYLQQEKTKEYQNRMLSDYGFEPDWDLLDSLIVMVDSVKRGKLKDSLPFSSLYLTVMVLDDELLNRNIIRFHDGGIMIRSFISRIESFPPGKAPDLEDRFFMENMFEDMALRYVLPDLAVKKGLDTLQSFREESAHYVENSLIQKFNEKLFSEMPSASDGDLREYHSRHQENFIKPDQVRVSAISVKTEKEASDLLMKLKAGANFIALASKYSTDKKTGSIGGDLGFFTVKRFTEIYQAAEGMGIGDLGGPVAMYGNYWIFKVTARIAGQPKTFEMSRPDVQSAYWNERRTEAIRTWVESRIANGDYFMDIEILRNENYPKPAVPETEINETKENK